MRQATRLKKLLDNPLAVRRGVYGPYAQSVERFDEQCRQVLAETRHLKLLASYRRTENVVVNGMGGSGLGADILLAALAEELRRPVALTHDYTVPPFVDRRTLYLACSYSGGTEEVLASLREARRRHAKIAVLTSGGALARSARRLKLPAYVFTTPHNPSGQPRLGLGYSTLGVWALLGKAGVLPYHPELVDDFLTAGRRAARRFAAEVRTTRNRAKQLALAMHGRLPLFITGSHLSGVAHTWANSCHESAKHFALYQTLPELNHHLLEGLKYPAVARSLIAVFGESPNDPPAIQRRATVTAQVFERHGIPILRYRTARGSWIAQAGELLQLAIYGSWYLATLNRVNPQAIPWVDFFKAKLAKHS